MNYDRFNEHYESIFRLENPEWALTGTAYAPEIAGQFPEIISAARVSSWEGNETTIMIRDRMLTLSNLIYADSSVLSIFSLDFIKGNPQSCLTDPHSIVLTESSARKIFGSEDPMNKSIKINNKVTFTVTGIIRDVTQFHLKLNAIAPFHVLKEYYDRPDFLEKYDSWNYYTYFRIKESSNPEALSEKINDYYTGKANWKDSRPEFSLRPLKEIYYTQVKNDFPLTKASRPMLRIYLIIAVFILIIACVNFVNLAIAKAATRSREIGVRKVIGARRHHLVPQFLGESIIYALIATELSMAVMELFRPVFNSLVQRQLDFLSLGWGWILFIIVLLPLLIGVLAGLYPAFFLTRYSAISTMKNEKTKGKGSLGFRSVLIVLQFTISIVLIIGTFTVARQLLYIQRADLGYNKENILQLSMNGSLNEHRQTFINMLRSNSAIKGVSMSTQSLENVSWQEGITVEEENKSFTYLGIDPEFISLMDLKIAEGRNFRSDILSDSGKVMINEEAVGYFGLKSPVVGQFIGTGDYRLEVLGVVKDFHFRSLRSPIGPLVMSLRKDWMSTVNIKISPENLPETVQFLEEVWNKLCPSFLFGYRFLDESYERLYNDEKRLSKTIIYMSVLAVFIACIGLLGLSSYMAQRRIKEIGIRKALGDTTIGIININRQRFW